MSVRNASARHLFVRRGFTLIEMLVATALTLVLLGAVISMFGSISSGIADARSTLEMTDRLRTTATLLQRDLGGVTATMLPPQRPADAPGYFEIIEGPVGDGASMIRPSQYGCIPDANGNWGPGDTTLRDFDDKLMFTTRSADRPFVGRSAGSPDGTVRSDVAEVAWFLRGNTLYRRVLVVNPGAVVPVGGAMGFYTGNDVSVRLVNGKLLANSLADLAKRENRFAHHTQAYPYDVRNWALLGLPTLQECSSSNWIAGGTAPTGVWYSGGPGLTPLSQSPPGCFYDFWRQGAAAWQSSVTDATTGTLTAYSNGQRTDDVILTNVIGFDVKVWDPGVNMYVDLGYDNVNYDPNYAPTGGVPAKLFYHTGVPQSGLQSINQVARTYDTWSTHYETEGRQAGDTAAGQSTNGLDDNNNGLVDEPLELIAPPPYPAPLRGIQVKIRTFDPDSRQIREVTVIQEFLPK